MARIREGPAGEGGERQLEILEKALHRSLMRCVIATLPDVYLVLAENKPRKGLRALWSMK